MTKEIILASTSPRRRQLLEQIGVEFDVVPSNATEEFDDPLSPVEAVQLLARRKAQVVATEHPNSLVIGADTVVALGSKILGKPTDAAEATRVLESLSGKTHLVATGVALLCSARGIADVFSVVTEVEFGLLDPQIIAQYVATGEPLDKAGAYGIQGRGAILVQAVRGSYYNIVGLPLFEIAAGLRRHGY